jgi:hypothetical protein
VIYSAKSITGAIVSPFKGFDSLLEAMPFSLSKTKKQKIILKRESF